MINSGKLLDIVSGRRSGLLAILIRFGLGCLTPVYRLGVWWRNRRFESGRSSVKEVSVPVISVGNLTTGGTGKTPMVMWVSVLLRSCSLRFAIVSRGYGQTNTSGGQNDEALELEHRLPDVPHLQDADRAKIAQIAIDEMQSQVILLDDGFQHRQLKRDLDIVLIDATLPFGYNRLLPRGLLREPLSNLSRADAIVLTRCNTIDSRATNQIRERVQHYAPGAIWARSKTVAEQWLQYNGRTMPIRDLKGKKVLAFCGIGNPKGFEHSLLQLDVTVVRQLDFPDHHPYSPEDAKSIESVADQLRVDTIVCTHKDLVKLGVNQLGRLPLYALLIHIEFVEGEQELADLITKSVGFPSASDA